ncbi:ETS-related transcription factor Elf-5 [Anabrus simplex]|uniref:ETS-related transcription factor Elf-5 n=1 Tax=Anabrus simplex TaxID=316456 RepID=UPI0035A37E0E
MNTGSFHHPGGSHYCANACRGTVFAPSYQHCTPRTGSMPQRTSFLSEPPAWDAFDPAGDTYYCEDIFPSYLSSSGDPYRLNSFADSMDTYPYGPMFSTAALKHETIYSAFSDPCQKEWIGKPVKQWSNKDVMNWALNVIDDLVNSEYEDLNLERFNVEGITLCSWSEGDFIDKDPVFGSRLYEALKSQLDDENKSAYDRLFDDKADTRYLPPFPTLKMSDRLSPTMVDSVSSTFTELKVARDHFHPDSGSEQSETFISIRSQDGVQDQTSIKKKRGRPVGNRSKRKAEKKCGRLWEFIRDLLLKPEYCPSLICWENHEEGVFRFVRSDKVAELWGSIKENPKMTYEKLSRAMRYYYKSKVLQPVFGRRLVYKFGPTARGWRTNNPNFRQPVSCE